MDKKAFYLDERIYEQNTKLNYDNNIIEYWREITGKKFVDYCCKRTKFKYYFENFEYSTIENGEDYSVIESIFFQELYKKHMYKDRGAFDGFYDFLLIVTNSYFEIKNHDNLICFIWKLFDRELLRNQLIKVSIRTLILEISNHRKNGSLEGATSIEQYQCYINDYLYNPDYIIATYRQYPVMYREIFRSILYYCEYVKAFGKHYMNDFLEIKREFNLQGNLYDIRRVTTIFSDSHRKHKCTVCVEFSRDKKIIYKPRCLNNELIFQELAGFFLKSMGMTQKRIKIISKEKYGWMEYIEYAECNDEIEVKEYYRKYGLYLFLVYLLGTKDIHYANIIACRNNPILIDLEVLISAESKIKYGNSANDTIIKKIDNSVVVSGMLPIYAWNKSGKGVNVSAFNGTGEQLMPVQIPKIINLGTSEICIAYEYATTPLGQNLVKCAGRICNPDNYLKEIQKGFRRAFYTLKKNRHNILKFMEVHIPGSANRYIVRDTQQYSMILSLSYHPQFLQDAVDREFLIFYLLNIKKVNDTQILKSEMQELIAGDIPYFFTKGNVTTIFGGRNNKVENFCANSIGSQVVKRVKTINENELALQESLIYQSMTLYRRTTKKITLHYDDRIEYLKIITKKILNQAIYNKECTDVSWISSFNMQHSEGKILLSAMNDYLYSGKMGIWVFIKAYLNNYKDPQIEKISNMLERYFFDKTEKFYTITLPDAKPTGAFVGEASVIYGYQIIYCITRQKVYLAYAKKHCKYLSRLLDKDKQYDLLEGNAGAILVLINMFQITNDVEYLQLAKKAFEYIKKQLIYFGEKKAAINNTHIKRPLAGVAHGCAGYAYSFAKLAYYTGNEEIYDLVEQIMNYEAGLYDYNIRDWGDERKVGTVYIPSVAWCHGKGGILYLWKETKKYCKGKYQTRVEHYLETYLNFNISETISKDDCICHGSMGADIMLSRIKRERCCSVNKLESVEDLSFMTGKVGIAYYLLRDEFKYPDILKVKL